MEEKLDQMNAVLQSMQHALQCNICLDMLSKPLTTKCGHSFCGDCIQQVVKGGRGGAGQCPLCLASLTRRSLSQNTKITGLVQAVRSIITSIKQDCCFEVTPSKYRPKPRPVITAEDDDSENEEKDEPRRGTRKRGTTSHYMPEVHVPKARAPRPAKQRILASNGSQELSLHVEASSVQPLTSPTKAPQPSLADRISEEHSYSSPTKQEALEKTNSVPARNSRGRPRLSAPLPTRGRKKTAARSKDLQRQSPAAYSGKKLSLDLPSVSQQVGVAGGKKGPDMTLSEELGREPPTDKVAKWLSNSREVGFRIGASHSSESLPLTDSLPSHNSQLMAQISKLSDELEIQPLKPVAKETNPNIKRPSKLPSSTSSSSLSSKPSPKEAVSSYKKIFKARNCDASTVHDESVVRETPAIPTTYPSDSPSDPYNFIPSQKTPKTKTKKTAANVRRGSTRARGSLSFRGQGRVRGKGRGIPVAQSSSRNSLANTSVNSTFQKQSTPIGRGAKPRQSVNLSVIHAPADLTTTELGSDHNEQKESCIVYTHEDDDGEIPDSCPVNTMNQFDVMVSEVKAQREREGNAAKPAEVDNQEDKDDKEEAAQLFVTPAQPDELTAPAAAATVGVNKESRGKKGGRKRASESDKEGGAQRKAKVQRKGAEVDNSTHRSKQKPSADSSASQKSTAPDQTTGDGVREHPQSNKSGREEQDTTGDISTQASKTKKRMNTSVRKSKAEVAKEEVEAICALFDDVEDHQLSIVSNNKEVEQHRRKEQQRDQEIIQNLSLINQTMDNTQLNKTIPVITEEANTTMPPPREPLRGRRVRFNATVPAAGPDEGADGSRSASTSLRKPAQKPSTVSNVRIASEIQARLPEVARSIPRSLSTRNTNTKSPGWSHVAGARKDLRVRQTSLNVTGGKKRSLNDSRTEGGTISVHSLSTLPSSVDTHVSIEEDCEEVEGLRLSQGKPERVEQLKVLVTKLKQQDQKTESDEAANSEDVVILHDDRTDPVDMHKPSTSTTPSRPKEPSVAVTGQASVKPLAAAHSSTALPNQRKVLSRKGTAARTSQQSISHDAVAVVYDDGAVAKARESCSLGPVAQDHTVTATREEAGQDGNELLVNRQESRETGNQNRGKGTGSGAPDQEEDEHLNTEPAREVSPPSSRSTPSSKPRPPHHAISPTLTLSSEPAHRTGSPSADSSRPSGGQQPEECGRTSPSRPSASPQRLVLPEGQVDPASVVPFRRVGALCSDRCVEAVGAAGALEGGGLGRDLCLHAVPCELYQVLLRYMAQALAQQAQHRTCCSHVNVPIVEAHRAASSLTQGTLEDKTAATPHQEMKDSDGRTEEHQSPHSNKPDTTTEAEVHDSEVIPNSYCTEEMPVALPLPYDVIKQSSQKLVKLSQVRGNSQMVRPTKSDLTQGVAALEMNSKLSMDECLSPTQVFTEEEVEEQLVTSQVATQMYIGNDDVEGMVTSQSAEIPLGRLEYRTTFTYSENVEDLPSSLSQDSRSSKSLLSMETRGSRLLRHQSSQEGVKIDGKTVDRAEKKGNMGLQKVKELQEVISEVEKENLRNSSNLQPAVARVNRKPLQTGQHTLDNIIIAPVAVKGEGKTTPGTKKAVTTRQDLVQASQLSHAASSLGRPSASKSLFTTESTQHVTRGQTGEKAGKQAEAITVMSGNDSPVKQPATSSSKRKFKRIQRPSSSSSSDDSDTDDSLMPPKRKSRYLSSSSNSSHPSSGVRAQGGKKQEQQHVLDSEEMKDLQRLDQNVWDFFGHPDRDDDQDSHITIEDLSDCSQGQDGKDGVGSRIEKKEQQQPPSITQSDQEAQEEVLPCTEDVVRNVNADLELIRRMREERGRSSHPSQTTSTAPSFTATTRSLFNRVDRTLKLGEALLDKDPDLCRGLVTPLTQAGTRHTTPSSKPSIKEPEVETVEASEEEEEEQGEGVETNSHSSAHSSQNEAVSTQKQQQVKDEVEMLKARVKELEAAMRVKDGDPTTSKKVKKEVKEEEQKGEEEQGRVGVLPPACPEQVDSGEESEELFSSLPNLNKSPRPASPLTTTPLRAPTRQARAGSCRALKVVCTGLFAAEMKQVEAMVGRLGRPGSWVGRTWGPEVTHVVVKTVPDNLAQRTLKYLYGVAGGCWVLSWHWVTHSLASNRILPEEEYEVLDTTGAPGPHRGRTCPTPLFSHCQFCLRPPFTEVTPTQLQEMIELCGGSVVAVPADFSPDSRIMKLIVVSCEEDSATQQRSVAGERQVSVAHDWLIECIGMFTRICITPYLVGRPSHAQLTFSAIPLPLLEETQEFV